MKSIVWFRQDLRLADNEALSAAAAAGQVAPVFILDEETPGVRPIGGASRWWLHHSLAALNASLGGTLVLRRGPAGAVLDDLVAETGAGGVYWNRLYEAPIMARDAAIKAGLQARGVAAQSFRGNLLQEPWALKTGAGEPYKVFTPFWRALARMHMDAPAPAVLPKCAKKVRSEALQEWGLAPSKPNWAAGWRNYWTPGEAGAHERLAMFLEQGIADYGENRNRPDRDGVSRLSAHLHWGEISPRQVWAGVQGAIAHEDALSKGGEAFLREIGWREFSQHLLFHFPDLPRKNWRGAFDAFPWRDDPNGFAAWSRGLTGYPFVDAGLRELWSTGFMHNRVRMAAASFLIKHLRVDWRQGEAWFWDTLVDADAANNAASWQWVAGSGADAAPYFRIFNPVTQGERFDPDGIYVRRWVPELARMPDAYLHAPFDAPEAVLRAAGVRLGETYPRPIVDHKAGRAAALAAYQEVKA
jgi:deoxyribodipyrimidine photo-lyase